MTATSRPRASSAPAPARLTRDILVPMAAPALAVTGILIFSSMLASFSIPLMMGRGGGPQMLMIDVYYRYGQHGDFATASALGVVAYLLAMGAALVYVRRLTRRPRRAARQVGAMTGRAATLAAAAFFILGPLLSLGVWSFAERWTYPSPWPQRVGLRYWARMLTGDFLDPLYTGLIIAVIVYGAGAPLRGAARLRAGPAALRRAAP